MSLNTIKQSIQKTPGTRKSLALALVLCFSLGEVYGQSNQRTTKTVKSIGDTLQEGGRNIHFSDPVSIIPTKGINVSPYLPNPIIDRVNIDIRNELGRNDIHIDFTDFDQYSSGDAIIREVTIRTGGHHYTVKIEGKGLYLGKSICEDEYKDLLALMIDIIEKIINK